MDGGFPYHGNQCGKKREKQPVCVFGRRKRNYGGERWGGGGVGGVLEMTDRRINQQQTISTKSTGKHGRHNKTKGTWEDPCGTPGAIDHSLLLRSGKDGFPSAELLSPSFFFVCFFNTVFQFLCFCCTGWLGNNSNPIFLMFILCV